MNRRRCVGRSAGDRQDEALASSLAVKTLYDPKCEQVWKSVSEVSVKAENAIFRAKKCRFVQEKCRFCGLRRIQNAIFSVRDV